MSVRRGLRMFKWTLFFMGQVVESGTEHGKVQAFRAGYAAQRRRRKSDLADATAKKWRVVSLVANCGEFSLCGVPGVVHTFRPASAYWRRRLVEHRPEMADFRLFVCRAESVRRRVVDVAAVECPTCHGAGCGRCGGMGQAFRIQTVAQERP